jgi:hypothetical protein
MTSTRWLLAVAILGVFGGGIPAAQGVQTKNPLEGNPEAIRGGMGLFRGRCADCHGMDARGVRGPDITQVWASGRTDDGLFKTIKGGIPGTEMPATPASTILKPGRSSRFFERSPLRRRPIRRAATRKRAQWCFEPCAPVVIESKALAADWGRTCHALAFPGRATSWCGVFAAASRDSARDMNRSR